MPRRSFEEAKAGNWQVSERKEIPHIFCYVYMLSDIATRIHHYVGMTSLKPAERLSVHNSGSVPHTSKYRPWQIDAAIAVEGEQTAISLESYFKSHSGRAFVNKHLFPSS